MTLYTDVKKTKENSTLMFEELTLSGRGFLKSMPTQRTVAVINISTNRKSVLTSLMLSITYPNKIIEKQPIIE